MRRALLAIWLLALLLAACEEAGGPDAATDATDHEGDALAADVRGAPPADASSADTPAGRDLDESDPGVDSGDAFDAAPDVAPDVAPDSRAEVSPDVEDVAPPPCPPDEAFAPSSVAGLLYVDGDGSSTSLYAQTFTAPPDAPLAGVPVSLLGGDGPATALTCPDGRFAFGGLADGLYVLDPDVPRDVPATTTNRATRFAEALREGTLHIVAFGDSVPIYSPARPFPARLGDLLAPFADVQVTNIAVSGSESRQWIPGTNYFEDRLAPVLVDADVIVFTLGGNDVLNYLDRIPTDQEEAAQMLADVRVLLGTVLVNVKETVAEIQARAPHADIVYCMYPDYAASQQWEAFLGQWTGIVHIALGTEMARVRREMAAVEGIVIADLYAATLDADVTSLLIDPLHLTEAGADFYAREIFLALGGVFVDAAYETPERWFGFAADALDAAAP